MTTIKIRRDTAANWLAANPVLALAEPGLETDTGRIKYGDGTSEWSALPYAGGGTPYRIVNGASYASVPDLNGNVYIVNNDTYTWTFGADGNLTLPGNLVIAGNTNVFGTDSALIQPTDDKPLIAISSGANGAVSSVWVEDIGNVGTSNIAAVYANPTVGSKIVRIAVGQNGGGAGPNLWDFGTDGSITFPNNTVLTPNTSLTVQTKLSATYGPFNGVYFESGNGSVNGVHSSGYAGYFFITTVNLNNDGTYSASGYPVSIQNGTNPTYTISGVDLGGTSPANDCVLSVTTVNDAITNISASGTPFLPKWTYGADGTLTLPNGTNIYGDGIFQADAVGGFELNSFTDNIGGGKKTWTFGTDGELTLPTGGHLGPAGKGWTGLDGGNGNPVSLTSLYASGMYSSCITLGPGGQLDVSTYGDGTGQTGNWNFSSSGITFPNSTVQTTAWTGTVAYSNVTGTPSIPSLGNFAFSGDTLSNTLSDASTLQVGGNNWTFGSDGSVTFPDSTVQTTAWTGGGSGSAFSLTNGSYSVSLGSDGVLTFSGEGG